MRLYRRTGRSADPGPVAAWLTDRTGTHCSVGDTSVPMQEDIFWRRTARAEMALYGVSFGDLLAYDAA